LREAGSSLLLRIFLATLAPPILQLTHQLTQPMRLRWGRPSVVAAGRATSGYYGDKRPRLMSGRERFVFRRMGDMRKVGRIAGGFHSPVVGPSHEFTGLPIEGRMATVAHSAHRVSNGDRSNRSLPERFYCWSYTNLWRLF
jgi:hypothetical protein